jgi:RNA polymerase sigma factor (TIGR02999 family)
MPDITQILSMIEQGDADATEQLMPLVYDELRRMAAVKLAQEKPGQTLQATALVHEAYLRLVRHDQANHNAHADPSAASPVLWNSRGHFFAAAAESMRRILVDQARKKHADKRGGDRVRSVLSDVVAPESLSPHELLALNEALERLQAERPQHAALVNLRFFGGLTLEESAASLHISLATAKRYWTFARAWLFGQLGGGPDQS